MVHDQVFEDRPEADIVASQIPSNVTDHRICGEELHCFVDGIDDLENCARIIAFQEIDDPQHIGLGGRREDEIVHEAERTFCLSSSKERPAVAQLARLCLRYTDFDLLAQFRQHCIALLRTFLEKSQPLSDDVTRGRESARSHTSSLNASRSHRPATP